MIHIITPNITPRLQYVLQTIFTEILGVEYEINTSYSAEYTHVIFYGATNEAGGVSIPDAGLLWQKGVQPLAFDTHLHENIPSPFYTENHTTTFPFDLFSAVFYVLSRYEEYLPYTADKHGRFKAEDTWAHQQGCLQIPVVNAWVNMLTNKLKEVYPGLYFTEQNFPVQSTFDIDQAFEYKHKSMVRQIGLLAKSLLKGDIQTFINRLKTGLNLQKDALEVYDYLAELHKKLNIKPHFFFLLAKQTVYDRNIDTDNIHFRVIICEASKDAIVGIHPSYYSSDTPSLYKTEKELLQSITGETVTHSRQHYLRFSIPSTYPIVLQNGLSNEHSMGYASQVGFRAGTGHSHWWYNINEEVITSLRVHPFAAMDATLKNYLNLSPETALTLLKTLKQHCQVYHTPFTLLWHNESIGGIGSWAGWEQLYEKIIEQ